MRRGSPTANEKDQIKSYPTPNLADVIVWEYRDSTLPKNQNPEYEVTTPTHGDYPNHKLVYITPVGEDGLEKWIYVADRANQDEYNFSFTKADIGGTRFDAVARTYVTLRSAFTPNTPAMGAVMPNVPASLFTGAYVLAEKRQQRIGEQELDSLYVAETHVYVKRVTITNNGFNDALGVNLSRTTTLYYRGEMVSGVAIETLVADDKNLYWGTQVALKISRSGEQLSDNWFAVTEQQITLKRGAGGVLIDDWPIGQVKSNVKENPVPQKFRAITKVVQTTTPIDLAAANVDNLPAPTIPTGDEVDVRVTKINDYRYEKRITTETIETDSPLEGTEWVSTFGGGVLTTQESLVSEGELAEGGFNIVRSKVTPIGQDKFIKEVGIMDSFPPLSGSKYDSNLDIDMPFTDEVVEAGTNNPGSDIEPIDEYRSRQRTVNRAAVQAALAGIHLILPSQENIQLPNVLKSVSVLASRSVGKSNSHGWGNSYSRSNNSSLAVSADLTYEIEEGYSGPVNSEIHVFFLPIDESSAQDILSAVNAEPWPMYRPISSRVVITGNGAQRSFSESRSDNSASGSESSSVSAFTNVGVLPATLHGPMGIEVIYSDFVAESGLLSDEWAEYIAQDEARVDDVRNALYEIPPTYKGEEVTPLQKQLMLARLETFENSLDIASDFDPEEAEVVVNPETLQATSPTDIQYGRFVKSSSASIYGYGMVRVTAVVVNISQ
jgi:hypothetical protein